MRAIAAVALAALLLGSTPAGAYVPERTPRRELDAAVQRVRAEPAVRGTRAGFVVMRGGRILVGHRVDESFTPASLMKLATTTAVMVRFGPNHRLRTRVAIDGDRMWLIGGGDPTLSTEEYRRRRYLPRATDVIKRPAFVSGSPTLEQLAGRVAGAGVTEVGALFADESLFDDERTQPGWLDSYTQGDPDTGLLSALTVNEGRADLEGNILEGDPARAAVVRFRDALRARGIRVGGSVSVARAPEDARVIAQVRSPPIGEIVDFINHYSVNFPTEMLLKGLGAAATGLGTTQAGTAEVRAALAELGVPLEGFVLADGSGLSVNDRITPRTLARILEAIMEGRGLRWEVLRASLPVAGGPGTLLRRMTSPPTGGNLRGKTGQIRMVRAMAGWVTARDGVPLIYVAVVNQTPSPFSLTGPLDRLGFLLASAPAG